MQVHQPGFPRIARARQNSRPAMQRTADAFAGHECRMRNDRQSYFKVVRDLVHAQFELADPELSSRIWQDIADRDLDRGRILHLLYSCHDLHNDDEVMHCGDEAYMALVDPRDP